MLASYLTAESVDDTTLMHTLLLVTTVERQDIRPKTIELHLALQTKEDPKAKEDRANQVNPKGNNQASTSTQGGRRAPGRVYSLCAEAAVKDNNVDIHPTPLDTNYSVELADGKSLTTNTILRGCTLNLQNHLFKIDLLPIELGSFDVIVGMDWMAEHRAEVVCYEKYIRVPYGNDMLIVQGERSRVKKESRLEETEIPKRRIEDVPVVKDFPEVFPKDLPGLPPTRQVEFHIELIPGSSPVARCPPISSCTVDNERSRPTSKICTPNKLNLAERARISAINLDDYQLDPVTPPPSPSSLFTMAAYQRMIDETDPTQREEALTETGQNSVLVPETALTVCTTRLGGQLHTILEDMDRYLNSYLKELEAFMTLWDVKPRVEESSLEALSVDELITQLRKMCEDAEDHASNAQEEARHNRKEALEEVIQQIYRNNN
ncbi:putative reverse transcriptase domain-containing protein [Tanacetum coccineum]